MGHGGRRTVKVSCSSSAVAWVLIGRSCGRGAFIEIPSNQVLLQTGGEQSARGGRAGLHLSIIWLQLPGWGRLLVRACPRRTTMPPHFVASRQHKTVSRC